MVFNKLKGDHKKCYGLLLVLFTIFGALCVASSDASAATLTTSKINFYLREFNQQAYSWTQRRDAGWSHSFPNVAAVRQYGIKYDGLYTTGNYASLHFETNLVAYTERSSNPQGAFSWINRDSIVVKACSFNNQLLTLESNNVSTAVTNWWQDFDTGIWFFSSTLTLYGDVTFSGIPQNTSGTLVCDVGTDSNSDYFWSNESAGSYIYWEKNPTVIVFGSNLNDTLLQTQIDQNTTIINQNNEYYSHEYDATDNISGQSASDIQGATNAQTTSIIGTISSFVSALGSVQAGSCELTLPFPSFVGGQQVVNPCTGKDKAPTIVQIGSSMLLIVFFVPLAFIVLKMIYNEIRSWTNG